MTARAWFVALAFAAAASWWANRQREEPLVPVPEQPPPEGYFMTEAEITSAGPDGLPRYRLTADEIRQPEFNGPTRLEDVTVLYNLYSPTPWRLSAPAGVLSADQSRLQLSGGVEIVGESGETGPARMETEQLSVDTATHRAYTPTEVFLDLGPHRLRSLGMVAYLMEERVELQSSVHGRFLP